MIRDVRRENETQRALEATESELTTQRLGENSDGGEASARVSEPAPSSVDDEDAIGEVPSESVEEADAGGGDDEAPTETAPLEAVGLGTSPERALPRRAGVDADGEVADAEAEIKAEDADEEALRLSDPDELKNAVEAVLFSVSEPMAIRELSELLSVGVHDVRSAVEELRYEYVATKRAFRLEEVSGGVQLLTRGLYDPVVARLRKKEREGRLSAAALETVSVVAYKQPITKADLEGIRGVDCSQILRTLIDRGLIKVAGRDEGLGKPLLYGTTKRFLQSFGLHTVRDLPQPEDLSGAKQDG